MVRFRVKVWAGYGPTWIFRVRVRVWMSGFRVRVWTQNLGLGFG